ncbi:hypothetical protein [Rathayibacter sp. AY1D9]|uniref:hypothetical protein n=1 Tax=Rathayibacter sp. AY1D9 TaxID=2080548 RepID=UPI0011B02954|nr:hypothetical protein [Rathayibacter sp. AY1D9]
MTETKEPAIIYGEAPIDNSCGDAMLAAAVVGSDAGNTEELISTVAICYSPIYWVNAARAYPEALGLAEPTDEALVQAFYDICIESKKEYVIGACYSDGADKLFEAMGVDF